LYFTPLSASASPRALPPFPTRRSSDLFRDLQVIMVDDGSTDDGAQAARARAAADPRFILVQALNGGPGREGLDQDEPGVGGGARSEEHTSELQSRFDLVCRLLLEKKKK